MAVTRKPKIAQAAEPRVDVEALIRKGGSVAGEEEKQPQKDGKTLSVVLRIPSDIMERLTETVNSRRIKIPRHTWLLEAIVEKLDRESETNQ